MAQRFIQLLVLISFFIVGFAAQAGSDRYVLILSIDGLSPEALAKAEAPNIKEWSRQGVSARDARSVYPVKTITNHASMITGVSFWRHFMLLNGHRGFRIWSPTIF